MSEFTVRPLTVADAEVLREATLGNLNWRDQRFTMADVLGRPDFSHYLVFDPARGDFGLVAEQDGRPIGLCWALFLPSDDRGYGFVDAATPEVSLWVSAEMRGRGIGRSLLDGVIVEAGSRRLPQLSLSVEDGNAAKDLYVLCGFVDVEGRRDDGVMVRRL